MWPSVFGIFDVIMEQYLTWLALLFVTCTVIMVEMAYNDLNTGYTAKCFCSNACKMLPVWSSDNLYNE